MKKKNRQKAESDNEDDMFAFTDLTTLGNVYLIRSSLDFGLFFRITDAVSEGERILEAVR